MPTTTPKYDFTARLEDATTQLNRAQAYRDAAGRAQKTAEEVAAQAEKTAELAQLPVPWADKASLQASNAKGIAQALSKAQDALVAAGGDPAILKETVDYVDLMLANAKAYLSSAEAAAQH